LNFESDHSNKGVKLKGIKKVGDFQPVNHCTVPKCWQSSDSDKWKRGLGSETLM